METAKISQLYDLGETIAAELFAGLTYPWEALPKISDFIKKLGPTLDPEVYEQAVSGASGGFVYLVNDLNDRRERVSLFFVLKGKWRQYDLSGTV